MPKIFPHCGIDIPISEQAEYIYPRDNHGIPLFHLVALSDKSLSMEYILACPHHAGRFPPLSDFAVELMAL